MMTATLRNVVCQQTRAAPLTAAPYSYVVADAVHLVDEKTTERRHESGTLGVVVDDLVVGVQKTLSSSPGGPPPK